MSAQPHSRLSTNLEVASTVTQTPSHLAAMRRFGGVITVRRHTVPDRVDIVDLQTYKSGGRLPGELLTDESFTSGALGFWNVEVAIEGKHTKGISGVTDMIFGLEQGVNALIVERSQLFDMRQNLFGAQGGVTFTDSPMVWQMMQSLSKSPVYGRHAYDPNIPLEPYGVCVSYGLIPEQHSVEVEFATRDLRQMGRICLSY